MMGIRSGHERSRPSWVLWPAVIVCEVVLGLAVGSAIGPLRLLLPLALVIPLVVVRSETRVVAVGVLLLAIVNGIPFLDLRSLNVSGAFNFQDPLILGLLGVGGIELASRRQRLADILPSTIIVSLRVFTGAWILSVAIAVLQGTPVLKAVLFGRDLLAVWLIPVVAVVCRERRNAARLVSVLLGGVLVFGVAHIVQVVSGLDLSMITHPSQTKYSMGVLRVYGAILPLTTVGFVMSVGVLIWGTNRRARIFGGLGTAVLGIEQLIQLTRANYLALSVALAVGVVTARMAGALRWSGAKLGLALISIPLSAMTMAVVLSTPVAQTPVWQSVEARMVSAGDDVTSGGGTFGYRVATYRAMFDVLGNRWVFGLGFLHPDGNYFAALPHGSIRNVDLGIMSVLMPMGLLGLLPLLAIVGFTFLYSIRLLKCESQSERIVGWGGVLATTIAAVSAPTLGYLSTLAGLTATSVAVGLVISFYGDTTEGPQCTVGPLHDASIEDS